MAVIAGMDVMDVMNGKDAMDSIDVKKRLKLMNGLNDSFGSYG